LDIGFDFDFEEGAKCAASFEAKDDVGERLTGGNFSGVRVAGEIIRTT
jgi:hypothetical protein